MFILKYLLQRQKTAKHGRLGTNSALWAQSQVEREREREREREKAEPLVTEFHSQGAFDDSWPSQSLVTPQRRPDCDCCPSGLNEIVYLSCLARNSPSGVNKPSRLQVSPALLCLRLEGWCGKLSGDRSLEPDSI